MEVNTINVACRIKNARLDAKMTQSELGCQIGKSKQWISELERGNIRLSYEMAAIISKACSKPIDFFM